eukprot:GFUD01009011.1.p1 GENE.GFUD01009011.1~~GFUD01009011.1.p1  ORF type:complete len:249 (-),score=89.30 GFUD01009011.1:55-801(-)
MQFEPDTSLPALAGYTILLPCVSVGNVGQLATDVVLATLQPTLVSQVHHPSLIAVCGPDPLSDNSASLSCAMQLYTHTDTKLAVVQIRSGFLPGKAHQFMADLLTWCKQQQVARVVSLTSSHAHERSDKQLTGTTLRYLATQGVQLGDNFVKLEQRESFPGLGPGEVPDQIFLPGSGIAKRLLVMCQEMGMEGVVLSKFCEEGDNTRDGIELADYLNKWLSWVEGDKYKAPPSWKHLFGPPAPVEMYW